MSLPTKSSDMRDVPPWKRCVDHDGWMRAIPTGEVGAKLFVFVATDDVPGTCRVTAALLDECAVRALLLDRRVVSDLAVCINNALARRLANQ